MRRILASLSAFASLAIASAHAQSTCPTGYSHVTATKLGAYTLLGSGVLSVTATDASQRQVNFSVPGGGVELMQAKRIPVANGALTQTLCLPRSDQASFPIGYHFIVRNTSPTAGNAVVLDIANVGITTDDFSLDTYDYRTAVNPYTLNTGSTGSGGGLTGLQNDVVASGTGVQSATVNKISGSATKLDVLGNITQPDTVNSLLGRTAVRGNTLQLADSVTTASGTYPINFDVRWPYAYVTVQGTAGSVKTYDISLGKLTPVSSYSMPCTQPNGIQSAYDTDGTLLLYVTCFNNSRLYILRTSAGAVTSSTDVASAPTPYMDLAQDAAAHKLYIGSQNGKVYPVDITTPTAPVLGSPFNAATGAIPLPIAPGDGYIYTTSPSEGQSYVQVFNTAGTLQAQIAVGHSPQHMAKQGSLLYVPVRDEHHFAILDVSNPAATPQVLSSTDMSPYSGSLTCNPEEAAVRGSTLFLSCPSPGGNTLVTYDVSNPAKPRYMRTLTGISDPNIIKLAGRYLLAASYSGILYLLDTGGVSAPYAIADAGAFEHVSARVADFDSATIGGRKVCLNTGDCKLKSLQLGTSGQMLTANGLDTNGNDYTFTFSSANLYLLGGRVHIGTSLSLDFISGTNAQCLQRGTSGLIEGTGSACGSGSGSGSLTYSDIDTAQAADPRATRIELHASTDSSSPAAPGAGTSTIKYCAGDDNLGYACIDTPNVTGEHLYGYIGTPSDGQRAAYSSTSHGLVWVTPSIPWSCQPGYGDGASAITAGTYPQSGCYNDTGKTITLTGIRCYADAGSSTLSITNGTGTALLSSAVTCSTSFAAGTQSGTATIAAGDYLKFSLVADGTTKQATFVLTGTHP